LLIDTSGLLAALFPDQSQNRAAADALLEARPPLRLSPFVLAELDYLISTGPGTRAELRLLADVASGAYVLEPFDKADITAALGVVEQYSDLNVGLTDASLVVLSQRYQDLDVLTLDLRHFRALRGYRNQPFRLLPIDS
jgi:uncharacterized protein